MKNGRNKREYEYCMPKEKKWNNFIYIMNWKLRWMKVQYKYHLRSGLEKELHSLFKYIRNIKKERMVFER